MAKKIDKITKKLFIFGRRFIFKEWKTTNWSDKNRLNLAKLYLSNDLKWITTQKYADQSKIDTKLLVRQMSIRAIRVRVCVCMCLQLSELSGGICLNHTVCQFSYCLWLTHRRKKHSIEQKKTRLTTFVEQWASDFECTFNLVYGFQHICWRETMCSTYWNWICPQIKEPVIV